MLTSIRTIKITVPEVISTKIGLQGKFRFSVFFEDFYRVPLSKFSKNRKFFCSPIYVEMSSGIGILIVLMLPNDAALYDLSKFFVVFFHLLATDYEWLIHYLTYTKS